MSNYEATVIETGNSYALRVPKPYMEKHNLKKGQKIRLPSPLSTIHAIDLNNLKNDLAEIQKLGVYRKISDPVAWQRQQRTRSDQANRT